MRTVDATHFQGVDMVKAYLIGQISVTNPEGYGLYASKVPQTIADAGGRYVVRGGHATQVEGQSLGDRNVVIEFPSRDAAQAWYDGPAYQAILPHRLQNSTGALVLVDGYAPN
ncbi:hypothetical protein B9Z42_06140 [Limnohabitans sp. B9-3]|jgi:uncharacterized protein (DUF1330 family)|nr:hypothetical protein B9Z42_06140 [Limnohabitans sp. B9-3]